LLDDGAGMKSEVRFTKAALRKESGQAILELSVSIFFLLILVFFMVDIASMYFTQEGLREAVQEAAIYGSICPSDVSGIKQRLRDSSSIPMINLSDTTYLPDGQIVICISLPGNNTCGAPVAIGNSIKVSITTDHKIITPFLGTFIGAQKYPMTVSATYPIMSTVCP
jgi:Flp pilus assembly protein TadG